MVETRQSGSAIYQAGISKVCLEKGDFTVIGMYAGELDVRWANFRADLVDIIDPCLVRVEVVRRGTNDLDAAGSKVGGTASNLSKFSHADLGNQKPGQVDECKCECERFGGSGSHINKCMRTGVKLPDGRRGQPTSGRSTRRT